MEIRGNAWKYVEIHGNAWKYVEIHGNAWRYMEIRGDTWRYMEMRGNAGGGARVLWARRTRHLPSVLIPATRARQAGKALFPGFLPCGKWFPGQKKAAPKEPPELQKTNFKRGLSVTR